ncbi:DUF4136 domain-containing protein [Dyadobacter frigoris]|uniref:DUF4136 domain-containing protein n=1 Tax=Dyadobacter frigoris TaxID=2576211 RepID=A0A4U6D2J6_9BACT|nr:DUF4136 domain-containing protein [Dyadobacter frigoris]TKT90291.1 DUF4136 domain-containing protein [Dyadobacter frigoris]GLU52526.1 hypothetical protein Dfri01_19870 [Dyadobacter frigoris]
MKKSLILLGVLSVFSTMVFANNSKPKTMSGVAAHTYNWIVPDMKKNQNPMYSSTYSRQRIQQAFDAALNGKGLVRETQHPDLLLQFHTYTQRVRRNYYGGGGYPMMGYPMMGFGRFGYGMPYYGGYGYGGYGGYPSSSNNTDGTLILDVVDAKTGDIIWQKAISGDVTNPNHLEKRINKGVKKLMKDFPVRQG